MLIIIIITFTAFAQDTTYYVATAGSDSNTCGAVDNPCATIEQILRNYHGFSFTVSIAAGNYTPARIFLDSLVVFQGVGNPTITAYWDSGSFVTTSETAGFEFRDLSLVIMSVYDPDSGLGPPFSTLNAETNIAGFYNVNVKKEGGFEAGDFIDLYGGSLVINNMSIVGAQFDQYFIFDSSNGVNTNITVTGSYFSSIGFGSSGGFLAFNAYGATNILINGTTFGYIESDYLLIGFWAADENQIITISNNIFNHTNSYLPAVYMENDYQCVIIVQNTIWTNVVSEFVSGALETLGSDDGSDHKITLSNLTFVDCNGPYAGALLVGYNTLTLSDSIFSGSRGEYGNDVVQALDAYTAQFGYNITNSTSSSAIPKAVVWNLSTGSVTDISDQLPNSFQNKIHRLARKDVSAVPKFGRKVRKNEVNKK